MGFNIDCKIPPCVDIILTINRLVQDYLSRFHSAFLLSLFYWDQREVFPKSWGLGSSSPEGNWNKPRGGIRIMEWFLCSQRSWRRVLIVFLHSCRERMVDCISCPRRDWNSRSYGLDLNCQTLGTGYWLFLVKATTLFTKVKNVSLKL